MWDFCYYPLITACVSIFTNTSTWKIHVNLMVERSFENEMKIINNCSSNIPHTHTPHARTHARTRTSHAHAHTHYLLNRSKPTIQFVIIIHRLLLCTACLSISTLDSSEETIIIWAYLYVLLFFFFWWLHVQVFYVMYTFARGPLCKSSQPLLPHCSVL